MPYYRLYFMRPATSHIQRFADFHAPDDEVAILRARAHEGPQPLEHWCGQRKVKRLEPAGGAAAAACAVPIRTSAAASR